MHTACKRTGVSVSFVSVNVSPCSHARHMYGRQSDCAACVWASDVYNLTSKYLPGVIYIIGTGCTYVYLYTSYTPVPGV